MTKFELYAFDMRCLASDAVVDPTAGAVSAVLGDWGADMMLEMVSVAEEQSAIGLSLLVRYLSYCLCYCIGQNANASCLHVRNCMCDSRCCNLI